MRIYKTRKDFTALNAAGNPGVFKGTVCTITDEAANPMYAFQNNTWTGVVTATTDPLTGVSSLYAGGNPVGDPVILAPNGLDQSAQITQFFNDTDSTGRVYSLASGNFILGSPIQIYPTKRFDAGKYAYTASSWYSRIGMRFRGQGAGHTVLRYVGTDNVNPAILFRTSPTSNGKDNFFADIGGFRLLRCDTAGVPVAEGSTSGEGIHIKAFQTGDYAGGIVTHTGKINDIIFDGFDYPLSLDRPTLLHMERLWFVDFLIALRLGYNVDICTIDNCMFGHVDYQTGATAGGSGGATGFHNSAIGIQTGWSYAGQPNAPGGGDALRIVSSWFMKHGLAMKYNGVNDIQVLFDSCYFEGMKQYIKWSGTTAPRVKMVHNKFSLCDNNDVAGSWKFDGSDSASTVRLELDGCVSDGSVNQYPADDWIYVSANSDIRIRNCGMSTASGKGHIYSNKTNFIGRRKLADFGLGNYHFGSLNGEHTSPCSKISGDNIVVTPSAFTATETRTIFKNTSGGADPCGDVFYFSLNPGAAGQTLTIQSNTVQPEGFGRGDRITIIVKNIHATNFATIAFGSQFVQAAGNTMTSATQFHKTAWVFECIDSANGSNAWKQVSAPSTWGF